MVVNIVGATNHKEMKIMNNEEIEMKKKELIQHFGTIKALREASVEELRQVSGIGPEIAKNIHEKFHSVSEKGE